MSKPITDPDQLPQVCYKQHIAAANKSERTMIGCADAVIDVLKKALAVRDAKIATLESRVLELEASDAARVAAPPAEREP